MHPAPGHRQLCCLNLERRVFSAQTASLDQCACRIIRHGGYHLGPGEQCAQAAELRHAEHHTATTPDLGQVQVDVAAQIAGKRHHRMRPLTVFVQRQRPRSGVAAQHLAGNVAQFLALGIRRQIGGVAHTHGNLPRCQQRRHQQVIGTTHHHHDPRRLFLQLAQQRRKQAELGIVRQPDAKHIATGGRIELLGPADRTGNHVHRRLQLLENRQRPGRWLHGPAVAQQQWIIKQIA
ncbi:hypothetical protein D3C86_494940 [compost metagenome]